MEGKPTTRELKEHVLDLFHYIGEDPDREGLLKTPDRFVKAFHYLNSGYHQSIEEIVNGALFEVRYSEMVIVKDIEFYSLCEHHLLPFFGRCHVGYLPNKRIIGLSKIPRVVEMYSRRLQVQESLTSQIADSLMKVLNPVGVGVVMEAQHLCMMMRGVQKQGSWAKTSALLGAFHEGPTRAEFFNLIQNR